MSRGRPWTDPLGRPVRGRIGAEAGVGPDYIPEWTWKSTPIDMGRLTPDRSAMFCTTGPMDDREPLLPRHAPGSLPHLMAQLQMAMNHGMISVDEFRKAVSNLVAGVGEFVVDPARAPAVEPEHRRAIKLTGDLP